MKRLTTSEAFKGRYLKDVPPGFQWQKTPLQIYPLSGLADYFTLPTPLIQTDYNFLIFLKEGNFSQQIGTEIIDVSAPSVTFISAGSLTSLESVSKNMKGYFVLIEDKIMSKIFEKDDLLGLFTIAPVLQLEHSDSSWIYLVVRALYTEISSPKPNRHISHGLFQALLYKVMDLSGTEKSLPRTHQIAISFKQLVYSNYIEHKNVSFYAQELSVSENYLNRCVNSVFHKSAKELIIQIAILNSQILLWNVSKPISEVCYELNFEDPSYFSRLFKKVTGYTPREYRINIAHDMS